MKSLVAHAALFWFRRDLRTIDNAGLFLALTSAPKVYCVFVFDTEILDALPSKHDRRVEFIYECVRELKESLREMGGDLIVHHGRADTFVPELAIKLKVDVVYTNRDYEPAAITRDQRVEDALVPNEIDFITVKDTVIFDRNDVLTEKGAPFKVFTPYRRAWLEKFYMKDIPRYLITRYESSLAQPPVALKRAMPTLKSLGFERTNLKDLGLVPSERGARKLLEKFESRMRRYDVAREFPAVPGVSYLSLHNRFGTISIRELASAARIQIVAANEPGGQSNPGAEVWLSELIWRDFYFQILYHFPHVAESAFKSEYDGIEWQNDTALFAAWCEARTGFPLIDAAMRQINETGYMHNRLRMVVASFLTKDLLIDYRWGEKYFADHLNDFDLAANNGGWQWAASTGCDAQPYFRIFNPVTQSKRFDPEGKFIRRYVPELSGVPDKYIHTPWMMSESVQSECGIRIGSDYPLPIVDHAVQRDNALAMYRARAVEETGQAEQTEA